MKTPESRPARSGPDLKLLHKTGIDLLFRLHIVYKIARLYAQNNDLYQAQAQALFAALDAILQREPEAALRIRQSAVFFNGVRLKFGLTFFPIFKFIMAEFGARELGAVIFRAGLTKEEMLRFILLLARRDRRAKPGFADLQMEAHAEDLPHVAMEKSTEAEGLDTLDRNSTKIYFLSILHLKESFERDQRNEKIKIATTRRLMQTIFNHISDNEAFVFGLTNIKNHDEYTLNHSVNVCLLSIALGRRLGLTRAELVDLGIAAFFHDLGKTETPLEILNKPAKLSDEERLVMEMHPCQGAEKLIHLREFRRLPIRSIHVALEHHIKEDHTGYPRYFKRETINLFSKIVKITDYFDAITTPRVYRKKAFSRPEALALMLEYSGTEFHPALLKAFAGIMGSFPVGSLVLLSTGEVGVVFEENLESRFLLRPKVKIVADAEGGRVDGAIVDLAEADPATGRFGRTIVKPLDAEAYGIRTADYFLARAQA